MAGPTPLPVMLPQPPLAMGTPAVCMGSHPDPYQRKRYILTHPRVHQPTVWRKREGAQCRFCLACGRTIANFRARNDLIKLVDTGVYTPRAIGLSRVRMGPRHSATRSLLRTPSAPLPVLFSPRRAQSSKGSKKRTSPTRTTSGSGDPRRSGLHLHITLHHASAFGPPRTPHPALPALPKSSPPRRLCRHAAGPQGRRAARARVAPPIAARTRSGTSW